MPPSTGHPLYRGRFAPSPTGALHIGSLLCALASYLDARSVNGIWLIRIDDIDPPREQPGASDAILRTLEAHGLLWDESVLYQSTRLAEYRETMDRLLNKDLLYPCTCSRKQSRTEHNLYSGHCSQNTFPCDELHSIRARIGGSELGFEDRIQGPCAFKPGLDLDDFVVKRRDGLFSYQLAATADDLFQRITHVVRGSDLLDSSARQIYLMKLLEHKAPSYAHIPVLINDQQQKLSKQNLAPALDDQQAADNLLYCLGKLQQTIPEGAETAPPAEILDWAAKHWNPQRIPTSVSISI